MDKSLTLAENFGLMMWDGQLSKLLIQNWEKQDRYQLSCLLGLVKNHKFVHFRKLFPWLLIRRFKEHNPLLNWGLWGDWIEFRISSLWALSTWYLNWERSWRMVKAGTIDPVYRNSKVRNHLKPIWRDKESWKMREVYSRI